MKIIFDNEEQKLEMLERYCPDDINPMLENKYKECIKKSCKECWTTCSIEMEVKHD